MNANMIIGLTGNIGCGKSTAAKILTQLGAVVVDADQVSRELTDSSKPQNKPILDKIKNEFGTSDRTDLRNIVFNDEIKRKKLESILHPIIRTTILNQINEYKKQGKKLIIYEAPLLIEAGVPAEIEGVLLITCPEDIQMERILKRDSHLTKELALKVIRSQISQNDKVKVCKWVIENSKDEKHLKALLTHWFNTL